MKPSLEDERRALLEQIEASRAVYRRMLSDEPEPGVASRWPSHHAPPHHAPPRQRIAAAGQRTLQWMTEHPLWVAGGVALLVLLAPRVIGAGKRAARARRHPEPEPPRTQGGTLRALLTAAALLLRDPARARAAARIAQTAWQWLQRRRAATPSNSSTHRLH